MQQIAFFLILFSNFLSSLVFFNRFGFDRQVDALSVVNSQLIFSEKNQAVAMVTFICFRLGSAVFTPIYEREIIHIFIPALFIDRKSTRLNSSHRCISYAVF